jgi:membrane carboxypeptidase/penicillin-binding protein
MSVALKNVPEEAFTPPPGVIVMSVNAETGLRAPESSGISEYFYQEFPAPSTDGAAGSEKLPDDARNQLF